MLATVLAVLELTAKFLPVVIQTGTDLKPFAEGLFKQFKGGELTDDERTELRAAVDAQYAKAMEPLPPPQPGDPDFPKG